MTETYTSEDYCTCVCLDCGKKFKKNRLLTPHRFASVCPQCREKYWANGDKRNGTQEIQ